MEMEEIQQSHKSCKMSRVGNSIRNDSSIITSNLIRGVRQDDQDDLEDGEDREKATAVTESNRLRAWHSSRIFRVSRASGGKDRHSKVLTAKGLRDRRVRLSVSTAIQFYDLQDRLGYDQPSKAVEWLIKAAADAIAELPSLESKFPETPTQPSDEEKRSEARFEENDPTFQQHNACSSTSETSKGSVLSLSRTEIRVKARERARERAAKDKDKDQQIDDTHVGHQQNSQNSSFTELLTARNHQSTPQNPNSSPAFFLKQARHSPPTSMDYFSPVLFGSASSSRNQFSSGFSTQSHFGVAQPAHTMTMPPSFTVTNEHHHHHHHQHHHPELQQFSFLPDHLIPDTPDAVTDTDYNLNFSISSGLAGYNRGTLQSNSPSQISPHLQRFSSPADGSTMPFYIGGNAASSNATPPENHFSAAGFDGRLQLYYGDGSSRHTDSKKEKH